MLWILSFHIIVVITWFAGLFYLPRLFVYHSMSHDKISGERFKIMERKLFNGIMLPSSILVIITGHFLFVDYEKLRLPMGWLYLKLAFVAGLYLYFILCWKYLCDFKHNRNKHSHIFFRWFNEIPVLFLLAIVILAVVKPF
jgi:putative membrane protein